MKYEKTAKRMREALERAEMSAKDLSIKSEVPEASISQYVNGHLLHFLCHHEICRRAQSLDFTALPARSDMNGIYKNLPHFCPMCPIFAP